MHFFRAVSGLWGPDPGDPGLLTLLAAKAIAEADVIVYDALVNDEILATAKADVRIALCRKARRQAIAETA